MLQLSDELRSAVLAMLYLAKLLFPKTGELCTLKELFVNDGDEFGAGLCGKERLALLHNIATPEECFDDGGAGRGTPYAVFFERIAQLDEV